MTIYRDCSPGTASMPTSVTLTAYNAQTGAQVGSYNIPITTGPYQVPITTYNPCITPPSTICYEAATFTSVVQWPNVAAPQGFWLTYTSCCRNGTITNLTNPLSQGVRYYTRVANPALYVCNSSPVFNNWPPIVICANNTFTWNHSAVDPDGDSLAYKLCDALGQAGSPVPPWTPVNYASPYSGTYPISSSPAFSINPVTGIMSGTPTLVGQFVINVCLEEWRNGIKIGDHHREIQLNVTSNCQSTSNAAIPTHTNHGPNVIDSIFNCGGYTINFGNQSTSAFTFMWSFGDPTTTNDTSSQQYPSWTYPDTGYYLVTLITNPQWPCRDTDQAWVAIYPFLVAEFDWSGSMCMNTPVVFSDSSTNNIGNIIKWEWDFGDGTPKSYLQNPTHTYATSGVKSVTLVVTNDMGCTDTAKHLLQIYMAPLINAGADKTICIGDSHQINGLGNGTWVWHPGATLSDSTIKNPMATPTASTAYAAVVTGLTGCKSYDTVNVFVAAYPVVSAGPDFTICNNVNGKMAATASDSSSGALVYNWSPWLTPGGLQPPVPASSIPANTCKTYAFSATNMYGCKSSDTVQVCRNVVSVNLGPDVTICSGTGHQMTPVSANALQTYSWVPPASLSCTNCPNPIASPPLTITYTLNVTDTAGCPASDAIKVTVIPSPVVDAGPRDSVCTGNSIGLNANGSANVTYLWDNSDNDVVPTNAKNPIVTPAQSKYYYVTVTAANGCKAADSVWIEVLPLPVVQTSADFSICASDSIQLNTTGATAYTWIPPGQPGFNCTFCPDPWFLAFAPGVGTGPRSYVVQGVDIYGCASRDTITVNVMALPNVNAGADVFICIDDTTQLQASGAGIGGSYSWQSSPSLSCLNCPDPMAYPPVTETFTVTGTDMNGCKNTDKVKVNVFTSSSIFVTADPTICLGGSVPLSAFHPNASAYTWSPATGLNTTSGPSVIASPTDTTTYTVTVTDNNNCFQTTTVTVYVLPLPTVVASADVTICEFDSTQLDANGAISYSWTPATWIDYPNVKSPKVSPPAGNTPYTVTGTDGNGCKNTEVVVVTVNALPPVTAGLDTAICTGDTAQLHAGGANAYVWSPTTAMISPPTDQHPYVNPTITYIYVVEGTDLNGCKNTDAVQVLVNPLPPINAGSDVAICYTQGSATLNATGGASYVWSPDTSLSASTGASVIATPTSTTTYTLLGTDANGCQNTDDVKVTVDVLPVVIASSDVTICDQDATQLSASGAVNYDWSPSLHLSDDDIANPIAAPPVTITYVVTGTDANGCTDDDTVTVFVNPLPTVIAGDDQAICYGDTAQIWATGAVDYVWSPAANIFCTTCDVTQAMPPSTQTYVVTGTDANGCRNTDDVHIVVNPLPLVDAGLDFVMYKGVCIDMQPSGALSYLWSPSTYLNDPTLTNPQLCATAIDTVTYYVVGTDANGCKNLDSVTVRIIGVPEIGIPTAFSPNGDGLNDEFKILKTHNFLLTRFKVFDRWGQIVFETGDIHAGWDGTYEGERQPIGTYVFIITGTDEMGIAVMKNGNVTLIR